MWKLLQLCGIIFIICHELTSLLPVAVFIYQSIAATFVSDQFHSLDLHSKSVSVTFFWFFSHSFMPSSSMVLHVNPGFFVIQLLGHKVHAVVVVEGIGGEAVTLWEEMDPWNLRKILILRAPMPSLTRRRLTRSSRANSSLKVVQKTAIYTVNSCLQDCTCVLTVLVYISVMAQFKSCWCIDFVKCRSICFHVVTHASDMLLICAEVQINPVGHVHWKSRMV